MKITLTIGCLLSLLSACVPPPQKTRPVSEEEQILQRYSSMTRKGETDISLVLEQLETDQDRQTLSFWIAEKLEGSNFLEALEMERDAMKEIERLRTLLERATPASKETPTHRLLLSQLGLESARLSLLRGYLPTAPLPIPEERKVEEWSKSALLSADLRTLREMRMESARRIKVMENRIQEFRNHPREIVWDDYLQTQLLLRTTLIKLTAIEKSLPAPTES